MSKCEVTEQIEKLLNDRFEEQTQSEFIVIALGNFFTTDKLEEFYEFLKEE